MESIASIGDSAFICANVASIAAPGGKEGLLEGLLWVVHFTVEDSLCQFFVLNLVALRDFDALIAIFRVENVQESIDEVVFVDKLNFHEISDFLRAESLNCQLDEFPDTIDCWIITCILPHILRNDNTSNQWGYFPEVLQSPVSYGKLIVFLIILWDL